MPSFELPPDNRPRWYLFALIALAVVVVAGGIWWSINSRHKIALEAIPKRPTDALSRLPEIVRSRLDDAEQRARSQYGRAAIDALAELARLYHANGFLTEASHIYPALARLDPKDPRWPFLQANLLSGFGRLDEALPLLKTARTLAPDRIPLRIQLAETLSKTNQAPAAVAFYNSVISDDPGNIHALLGLAKIEIASQSWENAYSHLRLATANGPDYADAWNLFATVHEKLGQPAEAQTDRERAKKALTLPSPPDDWLDSLTDDCYDAYQVRVAADIARSTGNFERTRALLNHALSFAPDDATTHRQYGKFLADIGAHYHSEAREHLERATTLAPTDAEAWAWLIALDTDSGDTSTALNDSALALAHCPQSGGVRYEYARALKASGNLDGALYQFQETRRLRPEEAANVNIEIALIYFSQNRLVEGEATLHAALEADPGHPVAITTMARLAIGKNDSVEATRWIARAIAEPRVPRIDVDQLNALYRKQFR